MRMRRMRMVWRMRRLRMRMMRVRRRVGMRHGKRGGPRWEGRAVMRILHPSDKMTATVDLGKWVIAATLL